MDPQINSNVCEEQQIYSPKNNSSDVNPNDSECIVNDVMVVYDCEVEDTGDDYDLAMDGIILNGCSQYLFKVSIIVLPIIFLMVIVIGIIESNSQNNEIQYKTGKAFIVLAVFIGLLAFYMSYRYIRNTREEHRRRRQRQSQTSDIFAVNSKTNKISKKQLKFILQNPWHRINENKPKEQYSNGINVYVNNGLYMTSNYAV